jgi:hypothetical protein
MSLHLRRIDPDCESYVTLYEHPKFGRIDVGRISPRASHGNISDSWSWCVRCSTLAPVYSPDHGKVPNDQRTWVKREAVSFAGTAPTLDEALADWREHWPKFLTARSEEGWAQLKEDQDRARKQNLRYDYLKIKGRLAKDTQERVERELSAAGPVPDWLSALIRSKSR